MHNIHSFSVKTHGGYPVLYDFAYGILKAVKITINALASPYCEDLFIFLLSGFLECCFAMAESCIICILHQVPAKL